MLLLLSNLIYFTSAAWVNVGMLAVRFDLRQKREVNASIDAIARNRFKDAMLVASEIVPDASEYWEELGYLELTKGINASKFPYIANPLLKNARKYYKKAIVARPMAAVPWANLVLIHHHLDSNEAEMWAQFDVAMRFGRYDPNVQSTLLFVSLARWDQMTESRRELMRQTVSSSKGSQREKLHAMARQFQR